MKNKEVHILQGQLVFNNVTNRFELYRNEECLVSGFHCGDSLEVLLNGVWVPTAFEMSDGLYYLVGLKGIAIDGRTARKRY